LSQHSLVTISGEGSVGSIPRFPDLALLTAAGRRVAPLETPPAPPPHWPAPSAPSAPHRTRSSTVVPSTFGILDLNYRIRASSVVGYPSSAGIDIDIGFPASPTILASPHPRILGPLPDHLSLITSLSVHSILLRCDATISYPKCRCGKQTPSPRVRCRPPSRPRSRRSSCAEWPRGRGNHRRPTRRAVALVARPSIAFGTC